VPEYAGPIASPFLAGLRSRCPRCGVGKLYAGFLTVAPRCGHCGLDLAMADSGDGPAVFVILIVGFVVVGFALILEVVASPPTWLHMVLEIPMIIAGSLGLLRPFKATLIALQWSNKAKPHSIEDR
jgi:uncharacterized protein (DUF983 family)